MYLYSTVQYKCSHDGVVRWEGRWSQSCLSLVVIRARLRSFLYFEWEGCERCQQQPVCAAAAAAISSTDVANWTVRCSNTAKLTAASNLSTQCLSVNAVQGNNGWMLQNIAELWAEQRCLIVVNEPVIRRYSVWGPDGATQLQIILQHCAVSGIACSGHFLLSQAQKFTEVRINYLSVLSVCLPCLSVCLSTLSVFLVCLSVCLCAGG